MFILEKNGSNCVAFSDFPIVYSTETFYWFGDNNYTEWEELFDLYQEPPYQLPKHTGAYSFGIAGENNNFAIIYMLRSWNILFNGVLNSSLTFFT